MNKITGKKTGFLIILLAVGLLSTAQNMKQVTLVDRQGNETLKSFPEDWAWTLSSGNRILFKTSPDKQGNVNYGFLDSTGKVVIEPRYAGAGFFNEGLAPVGFVRGTESRYSQAEQTTFTHRIIKWGYIDVNGKTVLAPVWDEALPFFEGMAKVSSSGEWGFINKKGKTVVVPKYDDVSDFENGLASVTKKNHYSVIDTLGNELIPFRYSRYSLSFNEGLSSAHDVADPDHLLWGYIDLSGNWVIEPRYESVRDFHDSIAAVESTDGWGFINHRDEYVIQPVYRWVYNFSDGLCAAQNKEGLWGFINAAGNVCVPFKYTEVKEFSEGLAAVMVGYRWGFIDKRGEMIIEPKYSHAWYFYNGLAEVER